MAAVLRRLGYVYKKPKLVPGKANAAAQREFLEDYENLNENSDEDDVVMFMDATHPQHNPVISCGWIKRGEEHPIKRNTGRRRLNINGAIDVQRMSAQIRFDDTMTRSPPSPCSSKSSVPTPWPSASRSSATMPATIAPKRFDVVKSKRTPR